MYIYIHYMYIHIHIHICICIYTYIHIYLLYIHIYIYTYTHVFFRLATKCHENTICGWGITFQQDQYRSCSGSSKPQDHCECLLVQVLQGSEVISAFGTQQSLPKFSKLQAVAQGDFAWFIMNQSHIATEQNIIWLKDLKWCATSASCKLQAGAPWDARQSHGVHGAMVEGVTELELQRDVATVFTFWFWGFQVYHGLLVLCLGDLRGFSWPLY